MTLSRACPDIYDDIIIELSNSTLQEIRKKLYKIKLKLKHEMFD